MQCFARSLGPPRLLDMRLRDLGRYNKYYPLKNQIYSGGNVR